MANAMRWRYGDTCPVLASVGAGTVIEIGDIVYLTGGAALPVASLVDLGTKTANQEAIHDNFLGVAMQASPDGASDPIRVATSGVFEFLCPSASYELGDLVGVDENGSGDQLLNQTVAKVATPNLAVGRCVKKSGASSTRVMVDIESTVIKGGPQVMA
jgi:hypothetical protein